MKNELFADLLASAEEMVKIEKGAVERFINQRIQYEKSALMAIN